MAGEEIRKRVEALVEPVIADLGLELVDIDYRKGKRAHLCIYIDKPGGVTIDDCEKVSRALSPFWTSGIPCREAAISWRSPPRGWRDPCAGRRILYALPEKRLKYIPVPPSRGGENLPAPCWVPTMGRSAFNWKKTAAGSPFPWKW